MKAGALLPLLMIAILMTGGCSTTLVESLPAGKATKCDAVWPGRWKAVEQHQDKAGPGEWLQINADCTELTFIDPEKTQTEKHTLTLVSTRAGDFLGLSSPGDKPACVGDGNTHCGTELMRYVHAGNQISLYRPDHKKVHDALESHAVSGYTEMNTEPSTPAQTGGTQTGGTQTGQPPVPASVIEARAMAAGNADQQQPTYRNLIAGDPEQIALVLSQHPEFYESTPWLILQRDNPMTKSGHP